MTRRLPPPLLRFTFGTTLLVMVLSTLPPFERLELLTYDLRLILEARLESEPSRDEIVLLEVGDRTLDLHGRWPWSRRRLAGIIDTLADLGVRVLFLDVEFPEPDADDIPGLPLQKEISRRIRTARRTMASASPEDAGPALDTLEGSLLGLIPAPADEVFSEALRSASHEGMGLVGVYSLGTTDRASGSGSAFPQAGSPDQDLEKLLETRLERSESPMIGPESPEIPDHLREHARGHLGAIRERVLRRWFSSQADLAGLSVDDLGRELERRYASLGVQVLWWMEKEIVRRWTMEEHALRLTGAENLPRRLRGTGLTPPVARIARALGRLGASNILPDPDGVLRSIPMFWNLGEVMLPSATLALAHAAREVPPRVPLRITPGPILGSVDGTREEGLPLEPDSRLRIHWTGSHQNSFSRLDAGLVLDLMDLELERERHFESLSRDGTYRMVLNYRSATRSLRVREPDRIVGLADLTAAVARRRPGMPPDEDLILELLETIPAGPEDPSSVRSPDAWSAIFETLRARLEEELDEHRRMVMDRLEKTADPAERERLMARFRDHIRSHSNATREYPGLREELRRRLRGRIVLFGVTATAAGDLVSTPFESSCPGLSAHAQALQTILAGRFIVRPRWLEPGRDGVQWPMILLTALLTSGLLLHLSSVAGAAVMLVSMAVWVTFGCVMFITNGVWLDLVAPVFTIVLAYLGIYTWRYHRAERVREIFGRYVDPSIVRCIVEEPTLLNELGGVTRELTPFFSDLRNFTPITEGLTPDELSGMLVDYLSPMVAILHRHQGTLERIIGDAIVGMFGAPVPVADHPLRACLTALDQQDHLLELKRRWLREQTDWYRRVLENGQDLDFRVGIATGTAKVGNFGSHEIKNYSMNGDTVNLAARLEGVNKVYGTRLLVSEVTRRGAAGRGILFREVDRIRVKGRSEPVRIHEIVGRNRDLDPRFAEMVGLHEEGLRLYYACDFVGARERFAAALRIVPDDGPGLVLARRTRDLEDSPPPEDWDGVFTLDHK